MGHVASNLAREDSAAAQAFDRLADRYEDLCRNDLLEAMRTFVRRVLGALVRPGTRVLEVGCGIGLDTAWLLDRGCEVVACDPAPGMVRHTRLRIQGSDTGDRAVLIRCGLERLDERLGLHPAGRRPFDLLFSNFGALNCVERLEGLAACSRRLRPGGRLVLGVMSRWCAWEAAYFALRGRWRQAARRGSGRSVQVMVAGVGVPTTYHTPRAVMRALGREFALIRVRGLAVAIPPPEFVEIWRRCPPAIRRLLVGLDAALASISPFNRMGDHMVLEIGKVS